MVNNVPKFEFRQHMSEPNLSVLANLSEHGSDVVLNFGCSCATDVALSESSTVSGMALCSSATERSGKKELNGILPNGPGPVSAPAVVDSEDDEAHGLSQPPVPQLQPSQLWVATSWRSVVGTLLSAVIDVSTEFSLSPLCVKGYICTITPFML